MEDVHRPDKTRTQNGRELCADTQGMKNAARDAKGSSARMRGEVGGCRRAELANTSGEKEVILYTQPDVGDARKNCRRSVKSNMYEHEKEREGVRVVKWTAEGN